jgi:hypothetical protein
MSTHTLAPWVVEPQRRQDGAPQTFRVVSLPDKLANEWRKDWYTPSLVHGLSEADANLMAAAPEMLAALYEARDQIREFLPTVLGTALTTIEAAIAKAEGRS